MAKKVVIHAIFWGKTFSRNICPCKVCDKIHVCFLTNAMTQFINYLYLESTSRRNILRYLFAVMVCGWGTSRDQHLFQKQIFFDLWSILVYLTFTVCTFLKIIKFLDILRFIEIFLDILGNLDILGRFWRL